AGPRPPSARTPAAAGGSAREPTRTRAGWRGRLDRAGARGIWRGGAGGRPPGLRLLGSGVVIAYRGFTKIYGGRAAVDELTFTVPAGAVVALLGPNGSGKTTTIKAAAGLIRPDRGTVTVGQRALS